MRRSLIAAALIALTFVMFLPAANAQTEAERLLQQETQRLMEEMQLEPIQALIPETDVKNILQQAIQGDFSADPERILAALVHKIKQGFLSFAPTMLRLTGMTILCTGLTHLRGDMPELTNLCDLAVCLCAAIPSIGEMREIFAQVSTVSVKMTELASAILPSMLALLTACGGERSALGLSRIALAATGGMAHFFRSVLLSLLGCCAVLASAACAEERMQLHALQKTLRSAVHWIMGICFTVFVGCLALQSSVGAHYDSVSLRIAKYAVDKSLPIVGGVFKDSADTLIGCALIMKSALGTAGAVGLGGMVLAPAMRLACVMFSWKLCAAVLEPFGNPRICRMLCGFADVAHSLLLLLLGTGALCLIVLASAMGLGMGFV